MKSSNTTVTKYKYPRKSIISILLFSLILPIVTIPTAFASEIPIVISPSSQTKPAVYNDKVVWADNRNGNNDIYMYDISAGTEKRITSDSHDQDNPVVYKDRIVWQDSRNMSGSGNLNTDIYMYDLNTDEEIQITKNDRYQGQPSIYENKIVWTDRRNGEGASELYMFDIDSGTESRINTKTNTWQTSPKIYGDKIVWEDTRKGRPEIYMFNLNTGVEEKISPDIDEHQTDPAIYENKIVWKGENYRERNSDIFMYDLLTGKVSKITDDKKSQNKPQIYGNKIIWLDNRNSERNWDIYLYDINSGTEHRITTSSSNAGSPAIYNDKIIWQDYRYGNSDIFMYTLEFEAPVTTHTNTPSSENGWYKSNVTISLSASDDKSGIEKTEYRVNGKAWTPYQKFTLYALKTNTVEYRSVDRNGNIEQTKSFEIKIDKTKPTTTHSITPSSSDNTDVSFSATDNFSGIAKTEYRINDGSWVNYTKPLVISTKDKVEYRSIDHAGNAEDIKSFQVTNDKKIR
ncbi:hypothetical protein [Thermoactinomyces sp. DSM 45892]|uniref:OmpL47-type beta-barrel domain-containing protein n=1 Tax=Thermoactinomyces sp. DSM 45892 TaxID=1882753 RepID=UPI000898B036|nr:hypothetical protein [Thermoactinomyces sp. DSM 45892]SDX96346.1 beta propeller repeat-containing protein [Thermoactinomyces sp. DSM 45892]